MAEKITLPEAQAKDREQRDINTRQGVVEYRSGEPQSERIYKVTDGLKMLPGGITLGPGNLFHPTERQVENNSLRGKAVELTQSEYDALRGQRNGNGRGKVRSRGADIGIRQFDMADGTLEYALEFGLTEADFQAVEPEGANGQYLKRQVEEMVARKAGAGSEDTDPDTAADDG